MLWMPRPVHAQPGEEVCSVGFAAPGKLQWCHLMRGCYLKRAFCQWRTCGCGSLSKRLYEPSVGDPGGDPPQPWSVTVVHGLQRWLSHRPPCHTSNPCIVQQASWTTGEVQGFGVKKQTGLFLYEKRERCSLSYYFTANYNQPAVKVNVWALVCWFPCLQSISRLLFLCVVGNCWISFSYFTFIVMVIS